DAPWCWDQISLTAAIAEVLPVPAGPMTADTPASEVSSPRQAWILSALRGWPPAMETLASWLLTWRGSEPGPAGWVAASRMTGSWAMMEAVVEVLALGPWSTTGRPRLATATSLVSSPIIDRSGVRATA